MQVKKRSNSFGLSGSQKKRLVQLAIDGTIKGGKAAYNYFNQKGTQSSRKDTVNAKSIRRRPRTAVYKTDGIAAGRLTTRKKRRNARATILRDGYGTVIEFGKVYTGTDIVGVGHTTHPSSVVVGTIFATVFKKMMEEAGASITKNEQGIPFLATDTIAIVWRDSEIASFAITTWTPGVGATPLNAYNWFSDSTRPWNTFQNSQIQFFNMQYRAVSNNPLLTAVQFNLQQVFCTLNIKSSLKIQNRTVNNVLNIEADDIDNAPVYGKIYAGNGTGTGWLELTNAGTAISFYGDAQYGVIAPTNIDTLGDPQPPEAFNRVTRVGKILLNPGQIKTSTLSHKRTMSFTDWVRNFPYAQTIEVPPIDNPISKVGKFAFMMIEKMIDSSLTQPVSVALEHNLDVSCSASVRKTKMMVRGYKKVYG